MKFEEANVLVFLNGKPGCASTIREYLANHRGDLVITSTLKEALEAARRTHYHVFVMLVHPASFAVLLAAQCPMVRMPKIILLARHGEGRVGGESIVTLTLEHLSQQEFLHAAEVLFHDKTHM